MRRCMVSKQISRMERQCEVSIIVNSRIQLGHVMPRKRSWARSAKVRERFSVTRNELGALAGAWSVARSRIWAVRCSVMRIGMNCATNLIWSGHSHICRVGSDAQSSDMESGARECGNFSDFLLAARVKRQHHCSTHLRNVVSAVWRQRRTGMAGAFDRADRHDMMIPSMDLPGSGLQHRCVDA